MRPTWGTFSHDAQKTTSPRAHLSARNTLRRALDGLEIHHHDLAHLLCAADARESKRERNSAFSPLRAHGDAPELQLLLLDARRKKARLVSAPVAIFSTASGRARDMASRPAKTPSPFLAEITISIEE